MNRTKRNLLIFSLVVIASGWLYQGVNILLPPPTPQQNLGLLLWILTPLVVVLFLRAFGGDGWRDFGLRLTGHWGWYVLSLLLYPLAIAITVGLGILLGQVTFITLDGLFPAVAAGLVASLIKNIGEEFAWRGYLTPRFQALGLPPLANHLLTGLVWGLWHVPYWIFFVGSAVIASVTSLGVAGFIALGFIGIFPTALVYGELRLKTNSLWPAYLAHNLTNLLSATLVTAGCLRLNSPAAEAWFMPAGGGLVMMFLFAILGPWLLRQKTAQ
jgi:membrane protease YdiL (CAAX protease family)